METEDHRKASVHDESGYIDVTGDGTILELEPHADEGEEGPDWGDPNHEIVVVLGADDSTEGNGCPNVKEKQSVEEKHNSQTEKAATAVTEYDSDIEIIASSTCVPNSPVPASCSIDESLPVLNLDTHPEFMQEVQRAASSPKSAVKIEIRVSGDASKLSEEHATAAMTTRDNGTGQQGNSTVLSWVVDKSKMDLCGSTKERQFEEDRAPTLSCSSGSAKETRRGTKAPDINDCSASKPTTASCAVSDHEEKMRTTNTSTEVHSQTEEKHIQDRNIPPSPIIDVTLPTHSTSECTYLINPEMNTIHSDPDSEATPPKLKRLSSGRHLLGADVSLHSSPPDYHQQLPNLHLSSHDMLPVLHLKEEGDGLLHASPQLPHAMEKSESHADRLGSPKVTLPSLASFTGGHKLRSIVRDVKSVTMDPSVGPILEIHEQDGDYKEDSCKVQVLPMFPHSHDLYQASQLSSLYDTDDSTTTLSSVDLNTLRDPSLTSVDLCSLNDQHMLGSPDDKLGHNGIRALHIIPDAQGKPYLVDIDDEALPKVEKFGDHTPYMSCKSTCLKHKYNSCSTGTLDMDTTHSRLSNTCCTETGLKTYHDLELTSPEHHLLMGIQRRKRSSTEPSEEETLQKHSPPKRSRDDKENQMPATSGVQVLSTWKVHVGNHGNKSQSSSTAQNLLSGGRLCGPAGGDTNTTTESKYTATSSGPQGIPLKDCPTLHKYLTSSVSDCRVGYQTLPHIIPLSTLAAKQSHYNSSRTSLSLNSSGSEEGPSPPDYIKALCATPYNTPTEEGSQSPTPILPTAGQLNAALFRAKETLSDTELDLGRQAHNAKERARRARIKIACEHLRDLVPGMTLKTDKATVFEFAVQYIAFLKRFVGVQYDKEFLRQCSPY